jgi:hypothetical protein
MNNKFNTLVLVGLIIASCGNEKKTAKTVQLTVVNVTVNAADYVGKNVVMKGTVVHVCRHGGKRMSMIGEEPDPRFKITAGEEVDAFDVSLDGSDVLVHGVVQETIIDESFLDSWEAELLEEHKSEGNDEGKSAGKSGGGR